MTRQSDLAINGGPKARTAAHATGVRYADNELRYLKEALEQNTLFYGLGKMVARACEKMRAYTSLPFVAACSSGSAAVHLGLIAAGVGPGDEVIVTPNTDSGSVLGIIAEGAVPVFCDCDWTLQPTVETISAKVTDRTAAVEVVHLAGYPAPVDEIVAFCDSRRIPVVEDCAQSWGARLNGKLVGTFALAGCYSANDYKHISCGDGGFVGLSNEELYRRVLNYADKHYDRAFEGERRQAHHGLNYRMTELQGAVICAQLEKVDSITARHHEIGEMLRSRIASVRGARILQPIPGAYSTCSWTVLFVDEDAVTVSREQIVEALRAENLPASSHDRYDLISKGLFQSRIVRPWITGERSMYPFVQPDGRSYTYSLDDTPTHKRIMETAITIGVSPFYSDRDIEEIGDGILKVFDAFAR